MNTAQLITALESAVGLLILWVFVFVFWKDYCVDYFRDNVFTLRDELFLYAAEGNIDFEHPAYALLRERMNLSLRFAHEYTLTRFFIALKFPSNTESYVWEKSIESLPETAQEKLNMYRGKFALYGLQYMVLRSFFLAVLILCFRVVAHFTGMLKNRLATPEVVTAIERIEAEAVDDYNSNRNDKRRAVPVGA